MFAGEGDAVPHQQALQAAVDGMPAKRLSTAFDSVTLYGNDPDVRPDIYGKVGNSGVSIATLDDMKVLYSGFDLCAPEHLGVDDDQRPGADDPRDVHEHRDRPAARQVPRRQRPRADRRRSRRRSAPGRWQNVRGTVQADILKEDQGQNTCIFSTEFCAQGDGRHRSSTSSHHKVRNFYSVSISRLSHRRSRREPDLPARVHARRTASPSSRRTSRAACTSTTSRPTCRSSSRNGMDPEYTVIGPRRAPHLGGGDARRATAPTSAARSSSTTRRPRGRSLHAQEIAVQRHPHHAAGADRDLRQLQLAAHQRLRRGDHHADRGERCAARWRSS